MERTTTIIEHIECSDKGTPAALRLLNDRNFTDVPFLLYG